MGIGSRLRRCRWIVLAGAAVLLLAVASTLARLPLHESDKVEAARCLVAWIVEGKSIPGYWDAYPDAQWMLQQKRFFLLCDFVAPEVSLSNDPRVQRIAVEQYREVFDKHHFRDTDYLYLELKFKSQSTLTVELSNVFAPPPAQGYQFTFRRTIFGLAANGKFLWVR
jgi:hypothetical protein